MRDLRIFRFQYRGFINPADVEGHCTWKVTKNAGRYKIHPFKSSCGNPISILRASVKPEPQSSEVVKKARREVSSLHLLSSSSSSLQRMTSLPVWPHPPRVSFTHRFSPATDPHCSSHTRRFAPASKALFPSPQTSFLAIIKACFFISPCFFLKYHILTDAFSNQVSKIPVLIYLHERALLS